MLQSIAAIAATLHKVKLLKKSCSYRLHLQLYTSTNIRPNMSPRHNPFQTWNFALLPVFTPLILHSHESLLDMCYLLDYNPWENVLHCISQMQSPPSWRWIQSWPFDEMGTESMETSWRGGRCPRKSFCESSPKSHRKDTF